MSPRLTVPVSEQEWNYAKARLAEAPSGSKLKRKEHSALAHSFLKAGDDIYAYDVGRYLGKGGYGAVKYVQTQDGTISVCKITYGENQYKGMPWDSALVKRLGLIKKVAAINENEQTVLHDLGRVEATCQRVDAPKFISIMPALGVPVDKYLAAHPMLSMSDLFLTAYGCIESLYTFHTGIISQTGQARLHNDIKPDNVLMRKPSDVNVIDFGETFDINQRRFSETKLYRHPNPISFEPIITSPEVRRQTGPWYLPCLRYKHARRNYSQQSDLYLMASVIETIASRAPALKPIVDLMRLEVPKQRPTQAQLLIALSTLANQYESKMQALAVRFESAFSDVAIPGFKEYMELDPEAAISMTGVMFATTASSAGNMSENIQSVLDSATLRVFFKDFCQLYRYTPNLAMVKEWRALASHLLQGDMSAETIDERIREYIRTQKNTTSAYYFNWWNGRHAVLCQLERHINGVFRQLNAPQPAPREMSR